MDTPNSKRSDDPVVGWDLLGYPFNKKYPPDYAKNGRQYDGYPTNNQAVFFLDFAIEGYQVLFKYGEEKFLIQIDFDCALQLDPNTHDIIMEFAHANALIEQMMINGKSLLSRIDEVDVIELF